MPPAQSFTAIDALIPKLSASQPRSHETDVLVTNTHNPMNVVPLMDEYFSPPRRKRRQFQKYGTDTKNSSQFPQQR
jgi:hypothetical protein